MEYENLLYDFVDGTLDSNQEEQFFAMLSSNDDMRTELKQLMAMKSAIRTDYKAFTPKAESTLGIFSALGFDAPVTAPVVTTTAATVSKSFISKPFTQMVIASLSSAAITAIIMFSLFKSGWIGSGDVINGEGNNISKSENINKSTNQNSNLPVISSNDIKSDVNNNVQKASSPKVVYKYIYVNVDSSKYRNSDANSNITPDLADAITNNTSSVEPNKVASENINFAIIDRNIQHDENTMKLIIAHNDFMKIQTITPNVNQLNNFLNGQSLGFTFELKGSQYWFSSTEKVGPPTNQMFNNSTASLFYGLTNDLSAGIEYRRETFYQSFHGLENNTLYKYEQQPNYETWSAAIRLTPSKIATSYLAPFTQISMGVNSGGYVGRFMLGAEIAPTKNYSFILGADYSLFRFKYQSSSFYSPKIGMSIGFAVKL